MSQMAASDHGVISIKYIAILLPCAYRAQALAANLLLRTCDTVCAIEFSNDFFPLQLFFSSLFSF